MYMYVYVYVYVYVYIYTHTVYIYFIYIYIYIKHDVVLQNSNSSFMRVARFKRDHLMEKSTL